MTAVSSALAQNNGPVFSWSCGAGAKSAIQAVSTAFETIAGLKFLIVKPVDLARSWMVIAEVEMGASFSLLYEAIQNVKPILHAADLGRHLRSFCGPLPRATIHHCNPGTLAPEAGAWEKAAKKTSKAARLLLTCCNFTNSLKKLDLVNPSPFWTLAVRWVKPASGFLLSSYRVYEEASKLYYGCIIDVSTGAARLLSRGDYILSFLRIALNVLLLALSILGFANLAVPYAVIFRVVLSTLTAFLSCMAYFVKYIIRDSQIY